MTAPDVCVVVPLLNEGSFIREALDSLMAQDYPNIQVVAFDGGSTDGTLDILRSYPIQVVVEPGLGQMAAINRGWRQTTAEFVTWMAGDDRLLPGALERLARGLREHPNAGAVHADAVVIDERGAAVGHLRPGNIQLAELAFEFSLVPQTALIRRAALARAGMFNEALRLSADYDLFLRLAQYFPLQYLPFVAAEYRVHAGSQDAQNWPAVGAAAIEVVSSFFARPDITDQQRRCQARGLAGAYLFAAVCCCLAGQRRAGWTLWWRATRLQPQAAFTTRRGLGLMLRLLSPVTIGPYKLRAWWQRWSARARRITPGTSAKKPSDS